MERKPMNVSSLKRSNRAQILEQIRRRPASRAEISRDSGLTKSAVTMLTNEMLREGILRECDAAGDCQSPGRPSIPLDLSSDFGYAVGIMLHRRQIRVCLTDLRMNRIAHREKSMAAFDSPDGVVEWITGAIGEIFTETGLPTEKCIGIGISSPGPIDHENGVIMTPPELDLLHHYPLVRMLKRHFDCPIFLENNSVSLAVSDFYRRGDAVKNMLFVVVADGIGSALLQDGTIFRGARGYAGELGHTSVDTTGDRCACGNYGCLELYATLKSMKRRFGFSDYRDVVDGVIGGDAACERIFDDLVRHFGTAFVACVNLYDVESVVMFGEYSYRAELLTGRIEAYLRERSLVCKAHPVTVLPSVLLPGDADVAAAIPALNTFFEQSGK